MPCPHRHFHYINLYSFSILWGFSPCICLTISLCIYFIIIHMAHACTLLFYFIYYNFILLCSIMPWDLPIIFLYFLLFYLLWFSLYFVFPRAYRTFEGLRSMRARGCLPNVSGVYPRCQNSLLRHDASSKVNRGYCFPFLGIDASLRRIVETSCLLGHDATSSISRYPFRGPAGPE